MGVGILGGAFNPPHVGHVALARTAIDRFRLDRLLVRVIEDPGHREVETDASIRLHLAELAFAPLDEADVTLDRHARTIDSLRELRLRDPVFLIGADEFATFLAWKEPDGVLELARLGVATRPGVDTAVFDDVLGALRRPDRVELFAIEPLPVSSTAIREKVRAGEPIDGLVAPAVAAEIARLGLYR
ncbi:MAG: nicotinate-nicotinamide nucleotide adenylyltransferase [Actinobacteria bacterium]|nr:nicotinate-nicotinamide nucleotide adenylyltransferase [Actinomycetota bacterium]